MLNLYPLYSELHSPSCVSLSREVTTATSCLPDVLHGRAAALIERGLEPRVVLSAEMRTSFCVVSAKITFC